MKKGKWSDEEVSFLKRSYPTTTPREIAKILNRTFGAVKGAILKYKLTKPYIRYEFRDYTKYDLAYLAGIIDGEGNIQITKSNKSKSGGISPCYEGKLTIANTNSLLIDTLHHKFGGNVYTCHNTKNIQYHLCFNSVDTYRVLKLVEKYLLIKKEQAQVIFDLKETFIVYKKRLGCPQCLIDQREECYKKLLKLHHDYKIPSNGNNNKISA